MVLDELIRLLRNIQKAHPEARDATVWTKRKQITAVGYDKRHKPMRVRLE